MQFSSCYQVDRDGVSNLDAITFEIRFEFGDRMLTIVDDRCNDRSVGESVRESVAQMSRLTGTARRNHGNRNGLADPVREVEIVTELGAVAIDRVDAKLAGAKAFALERQDQRVAAGGLTCAI